jgi:hypothetical protein
MRYVMTVLCAIVLCSCTHIMEEVSPTDRGLQTGPVQIHGHCSIELAQQITRGILLSKKVQDENIKIGDGYVYAMRDKRDLLIKFRKVARQDVEISITDKHMSGMQPSHIEANWFHDDFRRRNSNLQNRGQEVTDERRWNY